MDLVTSPLFERLQRAEHVLIAGAGGGAFRNNHPTKPWEDIPV